MLTLAMVESQIFSAIAILIMKPSAILMQALLVFFMLKLKLAKNKYRMSYGSMASLVNGM